MKNNLIVVGSGAAGMMAAITAANLGHSVLLLEKLPKLASKLKATGGGRCNLTNTLDNQDFMARFGREGRFMTQALEALDHKALQVFFTSIGVETHAPDGFRIFPKTHNAGTIVEAMVTKMKTLNISVKSDEKVIALTTENALITGVKTQTAHYKASHVVLATGGLGYPILGATGDGHTMANALGHTITNLSPAMMPLHTKETWVENCRADTIAKVELRVDLKKAKKLKAKGDLIFTKSGIRGPVVLDFAREITPLLSTYGEVPIRLNLCGKNEEQIRQQFKEQQRKNPDFNTLQLVETLLPTALSKAICQLSHVNCEHHLKKLAGIDRDTLIQNLAWTPLTVNGHDGFKHAMITRGGISLKEIDPNTMQSKKIKGLYFCGEIMNLDGPCGGYNLQWSFASGHLAGKLKGN